MLCLPVPPFLVIGFDVQVHRNWLATKPTSTKPPLYHLSCKVPSPSNFTDTLLLIKDPISHQGLMIRPLVHFPTGLRFLHTISVQEPGKLQALFFMPATWVSWLISVTSRYLVFSISPLTMRLSSRAFAIVIGFLWALAFQPTHAQYYKINTKGLSAIMACSINLPGMTKMKFASRRAP